jgi:hypothetical protein
LTKSNKNETIIVISTSTSSLYRIIDTYCSIAGSETANFMILKEFDENTANYSIKNPNVLELVKLASLYRIPLNWYSEETLNSRENLLKDSRFIFYNFCNFFAFYF